MNLKDISGIYIMVNTETGAIYVGSAENLWNRIYDHLIGHSSNLHLQNS